MEKHFECGGCGIRPFIDLWLIENRGNGDLSQYRSLLDQGNLFCFAQAVVKLSHVWLGNDVPDVISERLEKFILQGGTYGSAMNRVALHQKTRGGKYSYIISRVFAPYEKLKSYYPILEKHRWLMPVMQIRRWFMLLSPDVVRMAKSELEANKHLAQYDVDDATQLLVDIGICKSSW